MRYADYKALDAHRRQWVLDAELVLEFDVRGAGYDGGLRLRGPSLGQPAKLTSRGLMSAAAVVQHVEAWLAGEVAELAPSGPWPVPGASP